MNPLQLFQLFLTGGGKALAGLNALLTEIGPAINTLAPDIAQDLADLNKTLTDASAIASKIATSIASAASAPKPAA